VTKYKVCLDFDDCETSPCNFSPWQITSFNRQHASFRDPLEFFVMLGYRSGPMMETVEFKRRLLEKTAFVLSYYEHGSCVWSLRGEGPVCRWDSTDVAGVLLYEPDVDECPLTPEELESDARTFVNIYTAWANGEIYGFRISDESGEFIASSWGYYDTDYMLREISNEMEPDAKIEWTGPAAYLGNGYKFAIEQG